MKTLKEVDNDTVIAEIKANPLQHVHADTGLATLLLLPFLETASMIQTSSIAFTPYTSLVSAASDP